MKAFSNLNPHAREAIELAGGAEVIADKLGLYKSWAVYKWNRAGRVPEKYVKWLAEETDWRKTPHQIDPVLFEHAEDGLPEGMRILLRKVEQGAAAGGA